VAEARAAVRGELKGSGDRLRLGASGARFLHELAVVRQRVIELVGQAEHDAEAAGGG
jgi:hypothetical protein